MKRIMGRNRNGRFLKIFASGSIPPGWLAKFGETFEIDYYDRAKEGRNLTSEEMVARLQGCQVLITELDQIDTAVINAASDLAAIIDCRAAAVNIDIDAATKQGIVVFNTPGRNADAVADLTIAMMIMVMRNVGQAIQNIRSNNWLEKGRAESYILHRGHELPGKTIGLIGVGIIGRKVAQRLRGFGVRVIGYDPYVSAEIMAEWDITKVDLDDLLQQADIVSLHAPVTKATIGMIRTREFGLMKPTAYFINTARAALVDEAGLMDVLTHCKIAGAALDVFHDEPISAEHPLLKMPHVITLPHLGGATYEVNDHHARIAYENLVNFLNDNFKNILNPDAIPMAQAKITGLEG